MLKLRQSAGTASDRGGRSSLKVALPQALKPGDDVIVNGSLSGLRLSAVLMSTRDAGTLRLELATSSDSAVSAAAATVDEATRHREFQFEAAHRGPGGRLMAMERGSWETDGESKDLGGGTADWKCRDEFSLRFSIGSRCYEIWFSSSRSRRDRKLAKFVHRDSFKLYSHLLLTGDAEFREVACRSEDTTLFYKCSCEPSLTSQQNPAGKRRLWRCRLSLPRVERPPMPSSLAADSIASGPPDCSSESLVTLKMSLSLGDLDDKAAVAAVSQQQLLVKIKVAIDDADESPDVLSDDSAVPMMAAPETASSCLQRQLEWNEVKPELNTEASCTDSAQPTAELHQPSERTVARQSANQPASEQTFGPAAAERQNQPPPLAFKSLFQHSQSGQAVQLDDALSVELVRPPDEQGSGGVATQPASFMKDLTSDTESEGEPESPQRPEAATERQSVQQMKERPQLSYILEPPLDQPLGSEQRELSQQQPAMLMQQSKRRQDMEKLQRPLLRPQQSHLAEPDREMADVSEATEHLQRWLQQQDFKESLQTSEPAPPAHLEDSLSVELTDQPSESTKRDVTAAPSISLMKESTSGTESEDRPETLPGRLRQRYISEPTLADHVDDVLSVELDHQPSAHDESELAQKQPALLMQQNSASDSAESEKPQSSELELAPQVQDSTSAVESEIRSGFISDSSAAAKTAGPDDAVSVERDLTAESKGRSAWQHIDESLRLSRPVRCDASVSSDLLSPPPNEGPAQTQLESAQQQQQQQQQLHVEPDEIEKLKERLNQTDFPPLMDLLAAKQLMIEYVEGKIADSDAKFQSPGGSARDRQAPPPLPPRRGRRRIGPTITPFVCRAERAATPDSLGDAPVASLTVVDVQASSTKQDSDSEELMLKTCESYLSTAIHPTVYNESLSTELPPMEDLQSGSMTFSGDQSLERGEESTELDADDDSDDAATIMTPGKQRPPAELIDLTRRAYRPTDSRAPDSGELQPEEAPAYLQQLARALVDEALRLAVDRLDEFATEREDQLLNGSERTNQSQPPSVRRLLDVFEQELERDKLEARIQPKQQQAQLLPAEPPTKSVSGLQQADVEDTDAQPHTRYSRQLVIPGQPVPRREPPTFLPPGQILAPVDQDQKQNVSTTDEEEQLKKSRSVPTEQQSVLTPFQDKMLPIEWDTSAPADTAPVARTETREQELHSALLEALSAELNRSAEDPRMSKQDDSQPTAMTLWTTTNSASLSADLPEPPPASTDLTEHGKSCMLDDQRRLDRKPRPLAATPPVLSNFFGRVESRRSLASNGSVSGSVSVINSQRSSRRSSRDGQGGIGSPRISEFRCRVNPRDQDPAWPGPARFGPEESAVRHSVCSATTEEGEGRDEADAGYYSVTRISEPERETQLRRNRRSHPVCQVGVSGGGSQRRVDVAWLPNLSRGRVSANCHYYGPESAAGPRDKLSAGADRGAVRQTLIAPHLSAVGFEMSDRGCDVVIRQTYPAAKSERVIEQSGSNVFGI